jgi:general stress protein 26
MSDAQAQREQAVRKLAELIGKIRVAMLTTITEEGSLWSRPLLTQRARFDGDLWFITRLDSPKAREVARNRQVSLSYVRPEENVYVSVSGTAQLVSDPKKVEELWDPSYQGWFPGGPGDPHLVLIRVGVERAEYWVAPDLTWPFVAQFVVLAPEQRDNPEYHARIVLRKD